MGIGGKLRVDGLVELPSCCSVHLLSRCCILIWYSLLFLFLDLLFKVLFARTALVAEIARYHDGDGEVAEQCMKRVGELESGAHKRKRRELFVFPEGHSSHLSVAKHGPGDVLQGERFCLARNYGHDSCVLYIELL